MGWEGAFCGGLLRKYWVGMTCRQTEQRMKGKKERGEGKVNVEEKATLRGASADATWSVEREGLRRRVFHHGGAGNDVRIFQRIRQASRIVNGGGKKEAPGSRGSRGLWCMQRPSMGRAAALPYPSSSREGERLLRSSSRSSASGRTWWIP